MNASWAAVLLRLRPRHRDGPAEGAPAFRCRRTIGHESHEQRLAGALPRSRPPEARRDRGHALLIRRIRAVVPEHVQREVADALDRVLETIRHSGVTSHATRPTSAIAECLPTSPSGY